MLGLHWCGIWGVKLSLKVTNPVGNYNEIWCNGAFINKKFVITSKKCIEDIYSEDLKVFTHEYCQNKEEKGKKVQDVHKFKGC